MTSSPEPDLRYPVRFGLIAERTKKDMYEGVVLMLIGRTNTGHIDAIVLDASASSTYGHRRGQHAQLAWFNAEEWIILDPGVAP